MNEAVHRCRIPSWLAWIASFFFRIAIYVRVWSSPEDAVQV